MDSILEPEKKIASNSANMDNETIKIQRQHFKSLTEVMSEGLAHCKIICDDNGNPIDYKVLSVNAAYEKHSGIKKEQIVGKRIKEIIPDMEQSWIELYGEVALTQKTKSITGYNEKTKRHYYSTAYSDKPGEFMMLFKDITEEIELKKAYDLVTKSAKLNDDLLENLQEGFKHCKVICDEDNNPIDFKILSINKAYTKQTSLKKEQIVGKTMSEVFPDMDREKFKLFCRAGITGKSENFIDKCNITGSVFDISSFSPRPMEFIWIIRDITEKEKARLNLEEAYQKVEKSEKLKSAFLANMSHEIRTPLNAILGCSELLEDKTLNTEDQDKCLNHIKNSGDRLLTIISDILDISKLDSKQEQLNYKPHCLNALIDGLYSQFSIVKKGSSNIMNCSKAFDNNDSCIETDAVRLEQIISNLLENAYKYTDNGKISFGYESKGDFLEFFVKDTGRGIPQEDQQLIFERFGQSNSQKNQLNTGTGLGIPIAKGFVTLFGGEMWLESKAGMGSKFCFKIPYIPCQREEITQEKPTVLVAEDEEVNFYLLDMWLSNYCNLLHATDGNEVLEICKTNDVDLILMDIKMPHLNGIETTIEIRKSNKKTPIIAQSAFVMQSETEEILTAGCNEIMTKPIKRQTFQKVLTEYLPQLKF